MIEEKLVAAELARRGLTVSDAEVEEGLRKEIAEQEAMTRPTPSPTAAPAADASPGPTMHADRRAGSRPRQPFRPWRLKSSTRRTRPSCSGPI